MPLAAATAADNQALAQQDEAHAYDQPPHADKGRRDADQGREDDQRRTQPSCNLHTQRLTGEPAPCYVGAAVERSSVVIVQTVPTDSPTPTNADAEAAAGRVALWLDPSDLRWLSGRCSCTDETPTEEQDTCARVRFRANAALHKAGLSAR